MQNTYVYFILLQINNYITSSLKNIFMIKISNLFFITCLVFLLSGCSTEDMSETSPKSSRMNMNPDDEEDPGGNGSGGTTGGTYDYLKIYMKGKNSNTINMAQSINSISAWSSNGSLPSNHQTGQGPAAVFYDNTEYVFHVSPNSDEVQMSYKTPAGSWYQLGSIAPGLIRSSQALSATVWNSKIYLAYKSLNSDAIYMIYSTNSQATTWSYPERIVTDYENLSGATGNPPYLTTYAGKLYVFWVRQNSNKAYYREKSSPSSSWGSAVDITGVNNSAITVDASAGVAAYEYGGKLYAVYVNFSGGNLMFKQILPSPVNNLVSPILSAQSSDRPSMTVYNNKLLVVYKGVGNNSIYYSYWDGSTWIGNTYIGTGETKKAPTVLYFNK